MSSQTAILEAESPADPGESEDAGPDNTVVVGLDPIPPDLYAMFTAAVPRALGLIRDSEYASARRTDQSYLLRQDADRARARVREHEAELARHLPYQGKSLQADQSIAAARAAVAEANRDVANAEDGIARQREESGLAMDDAARWRQHVAALQRCLVLNRLTCRADRVFRETFKDLHGRAMAAGLAVDG